MYKRFFKRMIDIIMLLLILIILSRIMLILAIFIKLESRGPVIFKQQRIGLNGKVFNIYKFRSMYMDAEERKKELMEQNKMSGHMFKLDYDEQEDTMKMSKILE